MTRNPYQREIEEPTPVALCSLDFVGNIPIDPDLWFLTGTEAQQEAVSICKQCPLQLKCAEYSLKNAEEFGVWGGLTPLDRQRIRKTKGRKGVPNKKH